MFSYFPYIHYTFFFLHPYLERGVSQAQGHWQAQGCALRSLYPHSCGPTPLFVESEGRRNSNIS